MMKYNTATLSNGLRVIQTSSASPVAYLGFAVAAGSRDELPGEEGLAHFCEHMAFKGTERRRAWQILNALEAVGGDLNAFTNKEETVFHAAILREHVARAIDLLGDIVFHSTCPQAEIDKEVEVICDEIVSYEDAPADLIYDEMENILFHNHPLGHNVLGSAAKVRTYTTADALRFMHRYYRPDNAIFFLYGDFPMAKLVRLLERQVGDTTPGGTVPRPLPPEGWPSVADKGHGGTITQPRHFHQTHVMTGARGYDIHDPRRISLYLLNNLLGGPGMNARLNLSLRERNALVYDVESMQVSYGDTGLWAVYFGCDAHDADKCRRLVRRELDRIIDRPLTERQLQAAKRQLKGQIGVACDNRENFAIGFAKSFLHTGHGRDIDALCRQIDAVTAEDIRQVACETMAEDRLTTLVFE